MDYQSWIDALRARGRKMFSLDTPQDSDLVDMGADFAAGFLPGVGQAMSARDFERARREDDYIGMGLSGLGMIPVVGGMARGANKARKGKEAVDALRNAPRAEALDTARQNAVNMLGLPENNTAMDRARALGFESGWAHGSPRNDITELRSSRIGAQGPGAYATNYLPEASTYSQLEPGATVYPLMVRKSNALVTGHNNPYDELKVNADDALLSELFSRGKSAIVTTQEKTPDWLLKAGAPNMPERQHFVSVRPENFRSRFAAFDPARIDEGDLLGRADPRLLALIAGGTATGATVAALRNKRAEDKKKKDDEE